jgi:nitrogen fixation-related uncharacterized protein
LLAGSTAERSSPQVIDISESEMVLSLFLGAVDAGQYDDKLEVILKWVNRRMSEGHEERTKRALAELRLGDRVAFSEDVTPRYLRGVTGDVVAFDGDAVVVCLGRPLGRFRSGHIQSSPLGVVKLTAGQLAPET